MWKALLTGSVDAHDILWLHIPAAAILKYPSSEWVQLMIVLLFYSPPTCYLAAVMYFVFHFLHKWKECTKQAGPDVQESLWITYM